jgi:transmembrane sensor
MTPDTDLPASVAEQAAFWWVTVNDEDCSGRDLRAFASWAAQSPERIAAYLRTAMVAKASKSHDVRWPETSAAELVREAKSSVGQGSQVSHESWRRPSPASRAIDFGLSRRFILATATAVVAAVCSLWFVSAESHVFQTGFGERRSILLEDGSRVTLNTESKIEVELRKDRRVVALRAGEALFSVAHDPKRPFEVRVGGAEIRDIGTQFNVDRRRDRTTITVVEGRVAVTPAPAPRSLVQPQGFTGPHTQLLGASDQLVIGPSEWQAPRHGVDLRITVSWTENKLIFAHTPVKEVAEEFNRYNRRPIRIEGTQLQRQEISGTFRSDDPTSFLSFLSKVPGVSVHDAPDGGYVVVQY